MPSGLAVLQSHLGIAYIIKNLTFVNGENALTNKIFAKYFNNNNFFH